jgi:hypothetical protein
MDESEEKFICINNAKVEYRLTLGKEYTKIPFFWGMEEDQKYYLEDADSVEHQKKQGWVTVSDDLGLACEFLSSRFVPAVIWIKIK